MSRKLGAIGALGLMAALVGGGAAQALTVQPMPVRHNGQPFTDQNAAFLASMGGGSEDGAVFAFGEGGRRHRQAAPASRGSDDWGWAEWRAEGFVFRDADGLILLAPPADEPAQQGH